MTYEWPWLTIASALLLVALLLRNLTLLATSRLPLPPGPTGHWFYGIKKMLPRTEPWKTYASWAKEYNVLNDAKSVSDLLEQRAIIYSDRPEQYMSHNICGRSKTVFNISSQDPHHRIYRRLVQQGLGPKRTKTYHSVLEEELIKLLDNIEQFPQDYVRHVRGNFVGVVMRVTYGYTINDLNDTFVNVAEETVKITDRTMANGSWLVDYYPIVRYIPSFFPGGGFKRKGKAWRERLSYLSDVPHQWVKSKMASGDYTESFTSTLLAQGESTENPDYENIVRWCAGGLYVGASDTTVSAITSFVLLMALHPKVQARAQAEIDEICGQDQLPRSSQVELLVYLQAVLKEILRYAPVGNIALPHKAIEDDAYLGYRIPKNATVIGNVWAIMRDPSLFPDPEVFSPERFLDQEQAQPDPRQWAFGFGRRSCPGTHFAETSILLVMAGILSRFKITLPLSNDRAEPSQPQISFTTGITSHINIFEICIERRSFFRDS